MCLANGRTLKATRRDFREIQDQLISDSIAALILDRDRDRWTGHEHDACPTFDNPQRCGRRQKDTARQASPP